MSQPRPNWILLAVLQAFLLLSAELGAQQAGRGQQAAARPAAQGGRGGTPPGGQPQAGRVQGGRATATPLPATEETELVLQREIFRYPAFQRRNPFRPLVGTEAGPRFEQMELRGVIYSEEPRQSVALLGLRGRIEQRLRQQVQRQLQQQEAGTAPPQMDTIRVPEASTRLKVGQTWGNVRVVQIERDHVVLDVTDFGLTERRTLAMMILRPGGLQ
jgi:hypothetical protein